MRQERMDRFMHPFWLFMLIIDLLIPIMMIGFGRIFVTRPPEKDQSHIRVQNGNVYEKQRDVGICTSIFWKMVVYNRVVFVAAFCYLPVVCLEQPNPHNRYRWRGVLDTTFSPCVSCFSDRKKAQTIV